MKSLYKSKEGWIRVVEAFVAVLLIAGVLLIVLNREYIQREDPSEEIYSIETAILQEIQVNDTLRVHVLSSSVPVEGSSLPPEVRDKIQIEIPSYLDCVPKICDLNDACLLTQNDSRDVYVRSVIITSDNSEYNPRKLKLFCSFKEN